MAFCSTRFAEQMLKKVGKVMRFDDASCTPGPKRYYRALVWIKLKASLIPGAFIEVQAGRSVWVDFRYEGVFNFCKRCGRIGHKQRWCIKPWSRAREEVDRAIGSACNAESRLMLGPGRAPLYTSKTYGCLLFHRSPPRELD